ncbi:hypothetical protein [Pseudomonas chlororaphis]|uniref:hypothetical protein n=1 Tax=Pseudomonas chlororaphis TaxID=587753 RepID=UPI001B307691|nr:hypothetical protein [Pseudomonas chlororaphis]MBP5056343.1 hypothetical protein [Pseudomonas chlororaphis]MBP5141756.1 hypothetical protein [Pseudomonas chlororaphis]MBP5144348.1 hypothetical protein [Pseudomonas chlororaphis]QTT98500.1 hypothetical protein HUT26_04160 [Pseudomonas chlororaphis]
MHVIAAPGHQVPKQDDPYAYIGDAESVDVPDTSYYRRRITAGELLHGKKARGSAKEPAKGADQ